MAWEDHWDERRAGDDRDTHSPGACVRGATYCCARVAWIPHPQDIHRRLGTDEGPTRSHSCLRPEAVRSSSVMAGVSDSERRRGVRLLRYFPRTRAHRPSTSRRRHSAWPRVGRPRDLIPAGVVVLCALIGPLLPGHTSARNCDVLLTQEARFTCWLDNYPGESP